MIDNNCAYSLGTQAALRIGPYCNATTVPQNPFGDNKRRCQWDEGFSDGTDWLFEVDVDTVVGEQMGAEDAHN